MVTDVSKGMIVGSSLSLVFTFFALILFYIHSNNRNKKYKLLILYITTSDFICSFGTLLGLARDGTTYCWFQGLVTNVFPLCSLFWTSMIVLQLYSVLYNKSDNGDKLTDKNEKDQSWSIITHAICWIVPIMLSIVPLMNSTYGCADGEEICWCFIADRRNTPQWASDYWYIISFYMWLWGALAFYVLTVLVCLVFVLIAKSDHAQQILLPKMFKLLTYPAIIVLCWTLPTIKDILSIFTPNSYLQTSTSFAVMSALSPCLQGFFTAIFFITSNSRMCVCMRCCASPRKIHLLTVPSQKLEIVDIVDRKDSR